eukprot:SAG31_NODE_2_length_46263_cov_45.908043_28_plen_497_part_00
MPHARGILLHRLLPPLLLLAPSARISLCDATTTKNTGTPPIQIVHGKNLATFLADEMTPPDSGSTTKILGFCVAWSDKCKRFEERLSKVRDDLGGAVRVGLVRADVSTPSGSVVANQYSVNVYPTLLGFVDGAHSKQNPPIRYQGAPNSASEMTRWAAALIPNHIVRPVREASVLLDGANHGTRALLLTDKLRTPMYYRALAARFSRVQQFFELKQDVLDRSVELQSTLSSLPKNGKDGKMTYPMLVIIGAHVIRKGFSGYILQTDGDGEQQRIAFKRYQGDLNQFSSAINFMQSTAALVQLPSRATTGNREPSANPKAGAKEQYAASDSTASQPRRQQQPEQAERKEQQHNVRSSTASQSSAPFTVSFNEPGPLGMSFESAGPKEPPKLSSVKPGTQAYRKHKVADAVGATLIMVNGVRVSDMSFTDAIALLKTDKRPLHVVLQHLETEESSDAGGNSGRASAPRSSPSPPPYIPARDRYAANRPVRINHMVHRK